MQNVKVPTNHQNY